MDNGDTPALLWTLNDPKRMQTLERTGLLDSPPEAAFDRLTRMAAMMLHVPVALVSLVDRERQFFKSQAGSKGAKSCCRETPLSHSFCKHVVGTAEPLIVPDAREHPLLHDNAAVYENDVIAYLGIPLTAAEGSTIGSFCAIDSKPRDWQQPEIRIMQDLAAAVMAEVELRLLVRHFQENCLHMRDLELEREEMVQMLVHDLRNPLSSLLLGLSALELGEIPEKSRSCLKTAQSGALLLSRMVNDILDVGKAEAGRMDLNLDEVSARELLDAACSSIYELAVQAGVTVNIAVNADVGPFQADQEKLRRTLVNLISNAVQHTPPRGRIDISVRRHNRKIIFEIADTGAGIPAEAFPHIFEKFRRAIVPSGPKTSTGLGLPFCKKAVEAHGGSITLESELGKGTTFRVEIPERPVDRAVAA